MNKKGNGVMFPNYFLFNEIPVFVFYRMQSRVCDENEATTILIWRSAIILTSKAVIEFDSNDQIKMFAFRLLPFT